MLRKGGSAIAAVWFKQLRYRHFPFFSNNHDTSEACLVSKRKTLPRPCSARPRLSTIESNSLEFDDQEPWDDEADVESSACKAFNPNDND